MANVFASVKALLRLDSVCIDNNVFRMHYKATVVILVAFSVVVSSRQFIGDAIDCFSIPPPPENIMDTYCWIHSTYTLTDDMKDKFGDGRIYPGVGSRLNDSQKVIYHKYYQWVYFVLLFQAMLFYIPRYLWKTWEGGQMKRLSCPIVDDDNKCGRKKFILDDFRLNLKNHNFYAFRFFFCELLNLVNVVGQMFFMISFLGKEFTTYGSDVLTMNEANPVDPMAKIFPKVTQCTFKHYGPSGDVVTYDGLCLLPHNLFNEKIYFFLWFWLIIVAVISGISLIYRLATVFRSQVRMWLLRVKYHLPEQRHIDRISQKCQVGTWFVLYQLGKNIDPLIYRELIEELGDRLCDNGEQEEQKDMKVAKLN